MPDDMFFTQDMRSLRRGRRIAQRTPIFRPCMVWIQDLPDTKYRGVVLDINGYGMRIRMMDMIPPETLVTIQLMKDEEFKLPLARPIDATVARIQESNGLADHGVRVASRKDASQQVKSAAEAGSAAASCDARIFTLDMIRSRRPRQSGR